MPEYLVKGWVQVEVSAKFSARNLNQAKHIVKETHGNGLPDEYTYEEGNWVSPVEIESIEKVEGSEKGAQKERAQ